MSGLVEILDEMADTLDAAVNAADDFPVQVVGRRNFNPTPPALDMYPAPQFRTEDGAGFGEVGGAYVFTVRARVSAADSLAEQDLLLSFMDDEHDRSVAVALEDDQTLNGLASSVKVDGPTGFTLYQDVAGQQAFLGVEWQVTVLNLTS